MHLRFGSRFGPLAREAARLVAREVDGVESRASVGGHGAVDGDPAAHLGELLDLSGSVALARTLAERGAAREPDLSTRLAPLSVGRARDALRDDFAGLAAEVRRAFHRLKTRHQRATADGGQDRFGAQDLFDAPPPSARRARLHSRVRGSRARADSARPSEARPTSDLGKLLTTALADEASRILLDAHRRACALRASLALDLASLSAPAAKLARLDDAVGGATDAEIGQRLGRLVPAACLDFERRLAEPTDAPPTETQATDALLASLERAVRAVLDFHQRRLEALVDACADLAARSGGRAVERARSQGQVEP